MGKIIGLVSDVGDKLAALLVPSVGVAKAADCWTERRCDRDQFGSYLYLRTCCRYQSGFTSCSPWGYQCFQCC
ncbi:hypothetical protein E1292_17540 [Nonomuraea deserti]|jgi:hypothetical protein|uniref:Uncharacterized protein n=1 Tax=Nonomuraea deserti TaxID=1848322 RepID=A0A4R4VJU4_9ACTN|nr:hypothetical protein [Nonomuraea deserti]TDD05261.1 hypothetical protein E1292_17540 [Nonomuraea deserti]